MVSNSDVDVRLAVLSNENRHLLQELKELKAYVDKRDEHIRNTLIHTYDDKFLLQREYDEKISAKIGINTELLREYTQKFDEVENMGRGMGKAVLIVGGMVVGLVSAAYGVFRIIHDLGGR